MLYYLMEMLDHADNPVRLHLCDQPPYAEREKSLLNFLHTFFAFADIGNQTRATCALSITPLRLSIMHEMHLK